MTQQEQVSRRRDEELRIIRHDAVTDKLQVSSAKLFVMIANGQFPKPFVIVPGGRAVGWLECDVDAWILARSCEVGGGK